MSLWPSRILVGISLALLVVGWNVWAGASWFVLWIAAALWDRKLRNTGS
jgi:hypothetical protein